jgi:antitoxin MazE
MNTKVPKWGRSLALRIPQSFAKDLHLEYGTEVDLSLRDGAMVVDSRPTRRHPLAGLLKKINKKNIHGEIRTGRLE